MSGYPPPAGHTPSPRYYSADPGVMLNPNFRAAPPSQTTPYPLSFSHNLFRPAASRPSVRCPESSAQTGAVEQYDGMSEPAHPAHSGNGCSRRRSGPSDQVKHRRTRSGCFTCRQRRVKCDESRPACDRCRKGNRECAYPDAQSIQRAGRNGPKSTNLSPTKGPWSSPGNQDGEMSLSVIHDDEKEEEEEEAEEADCDEDIMSRSQELRGSPHNSASTSDQSASPSTEASATLPSSACPPLSRRSSVRATASSPTTKVSSQTTRDLCFFLNYFQNHITIHHYSLKLDGQNFLKGEFLTRALKFEPLKYAVAGYAAYFYTLSRPDSPISTFLHFYNESVSGLRVAILQNRQQGLAIFLTILQLASIEEMLGDWINLMGHQKAAFEMLKRLYTPQIVTQSDFLLKVCHWYIRFDLFVGFQSGGEAVLGREWYEAIHERWIQKVHDNPDDLDVLYEERFAYSRLVAKDSNDLFARTGKGLVSLEEFATQLPIVKNRVETLESSAPVALMDPDSKVQDIIGEPNVDNIVNPYQPGVIWGGKLWTSNHLCLDAWSIVIMHNISESMALKQPIGPEIARLAYRLVQLFEAMCIYSKTPNGTIIETGVCFAIAALFLSKDPKTMWSVRRTFARIEAAGYIFADTLRNRMLESMGETQSDWWLPDDEACPKIIRSVKDFIRDRTTTPKDQVSDDLREMRGILSSLTLSDSTSESSTVTSADGVCTAGAPG